MFGHINLDFVSFQMLIWFLSQSCCSTEPRLLNTLFTFDKRHEHLLWVACKNMFSLVPFDSGQ